MKTIYLKGDVGWEITGESILEKIDINSKENLRVIVNSPGGSIIEAFGIYNIFKSYKGQVEFVIMPYAASAMSYIIMAGDKITSFKNPVFMTHRAQSFAFGDYDEMVTMANIMQGMENVIIEAYQTRIKKTKEEILEDMKKEWWLIGWEALLENNIIDDVIESIADLKIEGDQKEEIEKDISELSESNYSDIAKIRFEKSKLRLKKDIEKNQNSCQKIVAKLDISGIESQKEQKTVKAVDDKLKNEGNNFL